MMRVMRSGFFSGIFIVFLVMGGFSLVLTDWTGSFRSGVSSHDVARIGNERITQTEFAHIVNRTLNAERVSPQQAYQVGLINKILTSEIWNRLLGRAAHQYGIAVSDDALLAQIQKLAEPVAAQEKTTPAAVIKKFIEQQNLTEAMFLSSMRREMTNGHVRDLVSNTGHVVSPLVLGDMVSYELQTRNVKLLVLPDDKITGIGTPDDKALNEFYDKHAKEYMLPERRSFTMATLKPDTIKKDIKVTDADIKAFYDEHKDEMTKPETRVLQMAVYGEKDVENAKKLLDAVKSGKDLMDMAKKTGKPLATTEQAFAKDGFLPEMAGPTFEAKVGDVIGPIKSPLGWHVAKLKAIRAPGAESLADATQKIRTQLEADKLSDAMDATLDALDKAHESNEALAAIAKAHGMDVVTFDGLARDGKKADSSDAFKDLAAVKAPILTAAFTGEQTGRTTPPIELPNGDIAMLSVTTITPAKPKDLAVIKDALITRWQTEQRKQKNLELSQAALSDLVGGKTTIEAVAQKRGLELTTLNGVMRGQKDMPAGFDRAAWLRLFDAQPAKPVFQPIGTGLMMAVVTSVTLPDATDIKRMEAARADETKTLSRDQTDEVIVQFLGSLNDRYNAKVNDRLLRQMFAPKDSDAADMN